MKFIKLLTLAALILPVDLALAQSGDMKGMDIKPAPAEKKVREETYKAAGIVKKTDPARGTVSLAHGPVKELKWPAMTMTFTVKDKALLDKLVVDKKVEFEFIQQGSNYIVTAVK